MVKKEKLEDIRNRYYLTLAERNFTEENTENYKTLSLIAKKILAELETMGLPKRKWFRNGFRLYNGKYRHVILCDHEKI